MNNKNNNLRKFREECEKDNERLNEIYKKIIKQQEELKGGNDKE